MLTRAAALAAAFSLLASPAFAGTSRSFSVGAVVVASATVSASAGITPQEGAQLQVQRRGGPRPMLLVSSEMKPLPESGLAKLATPADGQLVATILY